MLTDFSVQVRTVMKPFGSLSDLHWRHLAETTCRRQDGGTFTAHYDPHIVHHLSPAREHEFVQWDAWKRISAPILVFRGLNSDLLLPATLARMQAEQPSLQVVEVCRCVFCVALRLIVLCICRYRMWDTHHSCTPPSRSHGCLNSCRHPNHLKKTHKQKR
jgi:hypothetical protein